MTRSVHTGCSFVLAAAALLCLMACSDDGFDSGTDGGPPTGDGR